MIQIGEQRAGHNVVCPQCGERLIVPDQSVAQAETLYLFLKQKRLAEKKAKKTNTPVLRQPVQQSAGLRLPAAVREKRNEEIDEESNLLEELDTEDVDRWIKEFWTTQSKEINSATEQPNSPKPVSPSIAANQETAAIIMRRQETWVLFRTWLFIVFLFGLVGGFGVCSFFNSFRKDISENGGGSAASGLPAEDVIMGRLYYRGFDGERVPDADAVVMLLPLDRIPTFPISGNGLRPDVSRPPATESSIQEIKEMGGEFQRTDVDGTFSIRYENKGRYIILMISSHAKRSGTEPDTATISELKRFFRNPQELLGDYSFSREEYELEQGKYILRQTF